MSGYALVREVLSDYLLMHYDRRQASTKMKKLYRETDS